MSYGYADIINYFQDYAETSSHFLHSANRYCFAATDFIDFEDQETNAKHKFPFLIAGYKSQGVDDAPGKFTIYDLQPNQRSYNINIAIFKNTADTHIGAAKNAAIALDELADNLLTKISYDRIHNLDTPLCCFLEDMDTTINIYKTPIVSAQHAIGIILNMTFNFSR